MDLVSKGLGAGLATIAFGWLVLRVSAYPGWGLGEVAILSWSVLRVLQIGLLQIPHRLLCLAAGVAGIVFHPTRTGR